MIVNNLSIFWGAKFIRKSIYEICLLLIKYQLHLAKWPTVSIYILNDVYLIADTAIIDLPRIKEHAINQAALNY